MTAPDALLEGPAWRMAQAVASGEVSATALTERTLQRLQEVAAGSTIYTKVTAERARLTARHWDRQRAAGYALPPLAGVPFAVKNLFDVAGVTTLSGSRVLAEQAPARQDAVLVQRLMAAGGVLVGALNMDEFAYGFTTENSHAGACPNPYDAQRVAGGSSGGSAAALAMGLAALTLGSDTNGSIRVPSAFSGVWGLKPTFGRLPRSGTYPFVASLDHLGPFARSVQDLALSYDAMQGGCGDDPFCAQRPPALVTGRLATPRRLRVARLTGYFDAHATEAAQHASRRVAAALAGTAEVDWSAAALARAAAFVVTASEGGALHREHTLAHYAEMEPLSRDRLVAGGLVPAHWYVKAQRVRRWALQEVMKLFEHYDVLVAPATPGPAPHIGQEDLTIQQQTFPMRASVGLLTQPISSVGLPVIAAPLTDGELPLGVQLIAAPWREDLCFAAAAELESQGLCRSGVAPAFRRAIHQEVS